LFKFFPTIVPDARIRNQLRKGHVASIQLRRLIIEVEHGLLWGFLPRGDLKKIGPTFFLFLKLYRKDTLTALNVMASKDLGVACHQNLAYPSITSM
jgi:hypothetical protein